MRDITTEELKTLAGKLNEKYRGKTVKPIIIHAVIANYAERHELNRIPCKVLECEVYEDENEEEQVDVVDAVTREFIRRYHHIYDISIEGGAVVIYTIYDGDYDEYLTDADRYAYEEARGRE